MHYIERGDIMLYRSIVELLNIMGGKMMDIQAVKIKGFRNISHAVFEFNKLTAYVGLNGCGKSNIIDAIDFGLDFIHAQNKIKSRMMALKSNIPILKTNAGHNYDFLIGGYIPNW